MQYHLNGFRPGDPSVAEAAEGAGARPDQVDVLIIGCGPAGLTLAAQLAQFPEISTRIAERKAGPLEVGQADGIACRSIEMFQAFGFAEKVIKEGYHVNEVTFWRPSDIGALTRADRIRDVEEDLSEMPHVILSQARLHDFFLEVMRNAPTRLEPDYDYRLTGLTRDEGREYPLTAQFDGAAPIHAKYIVGCDGARSAVRGALGAELKGEAARQLWGVMDVLCVTDFPDIRLKAAIQSQNAGAMLIIPREGGYMVRMYIELDALGDGERARDRGVTPEMLITNAQAILAPYTLEVKEVPWWSAYEIGQRVCDTFDDGPDPRIFIAGDACHTHSPKAGQGMNVSMADAFNLGWKLAAVLRGQAAPALLQTYGAERRAKAVELIEFDRDMARLFSRKPQTPAEEAEFQRYFQTHGRYTAGVETRYDASRIVGHGRAQALASGLTVGKRFHSAPVVRLADAMPMQLGHVAKADGRWRLYLFAGADAASLDAPCLWLETDGQSPLQRYTDPSADPDSFLDVRAIYQQPHRQLELNTLPPLLLRGKGRYGLVDYEKIFCADAARDIFDMRGIDRKQGAAVLVRPDQYVAEVFALGDLAASHLFFDGFMA